MAINDVLRSEYGTPTIEYTSTGATLTGDTTMDDASIHEHADGSYATPDDLVGYHNHGIKEDVYSENSGMFRTKAKATYKVAVARPVLGVTGIVIPGSGLLTGFNFVETAGATALLRLRAGADVNQPVLYTVSLAAHGTDTAFPALPIEFIGGLFLELVNGNISGNIYTVETRNV